MIEYNPTELKSLTMDKVLFASRRKLGLSQREFAIELSDKSHQIDHVVYSQIENARIDIRQPEWDWLIPRLNKWLQINPSQLQTIRQQTEVIPVTESPAFITYVHQLQGKNSCQK